MNNLTDAVKNLIIINVIVFLGTMALPDQYRSMGVLHYFESTEFQPFQLVSSMFMHADFRHLLFNMFSLFFLGPQVERALGVKRFMILYLAAGFGATALHMGINALEYYDALAQVTPAQAELITSGQWSGNQLTQDMNLALRRLNARVLGASGCVYGVVIAFVTMFPNLKLMIFPIPIPVKAKFLGIGLIAIGLYSGFGGVNDGIAHFAHIGGAIVGFALVHFWKMSNLR